MFLKSFGLAIIFTLSGFIHQLLAQTFELNERMIHSYELIMDLRLDEAEAELTLESLENPENYLRFLLENYIDLLVVFTDEIKSEFEDYKVDAEERELVLSKAAKDSPWYRYCLAEIALQNAFARIKFEENFAAARQIRKAYKLLVANAEEYPGFYHNDKSLGILEAMIGTVPDSYQWAMQLLGMEGGVEEGVSRLAGFLKEAEINNSPFRQEGLMIYSFFTLYLLQDKDAAFEALNELEELPSILGRFISSNMAFRLGEAEKSIAILERPLSAHDRQNFLYLEYVLGSMYLYRGDLEKAKELIGKYNREFPGIHYLKESHQRLAWCHLIEGDTVTFEKEMQLILERGSTLIDGDKKAQKDAESELIPHAKLLEVQLRFDGGYYQKALALLQTIDAMSLRNVTERQEFEYRCGRVQEGLGNTKEALTYYGKAMQINGRSIDYFAPKSALQSGFIYEQKGELERARKMFNRVLEYSGHSFKSSLDQQAKAGLDRLKQ